MSITHVATAATTAVPSSVAVGDLVLLTTSAYFTRADLLRDDLLGKGWLPMYAGVGVVGSTGMVVSHWWRRWTADAPTSLPRYSSGDVDVVSIWRGAGPAGIRDAAFVTSTTSSTPVAPGVAAKAGDVAVVSFATGGTVTAVTPPPTQQVNVSAGAYNGHLYVGTDARSANGTTPPYTATVGPTDGGSVAGVVVVSEPTAPLAPALGDPAPSAVTDLAAGGTFTWAHKPAGFAGSASGAQEAYALRRRVGVGAYEYWNAGTASWSSTVVWNDSVVGSVTFPAGAWANETQYAWSVATREDAGSNTGPFAPDRTLFARTKPAVTITAPDAVVTTPQPEIAWDATYTSPWEAIAYEVSIFPVDLADAPGFDPATVAPFWTSGQYASTAETVTPSIPLANATSYAVFVRVQQTGGQWSDWERTDTLVSLAAPASPHVDAIAATDPVSGCPVITVTVAQRDNLLTAADASVEVPNSWEAGPNTSITETTDWSTDGEQSLKLTATAAGDASANLPDPVTVVAQQQYTGTVTVHAAAAARDVTVAILWEDADGTSLGSSPSLAAADSTAAGGVTVHVIGTAPPNATGARLQVTIAGCAAGEVHHADQFGIAPGAGTAWSPGGFADVTATVEFSDDPLSGVWGTLTQVTLDGSAVITDWTPQPGQLRTYRATTNAGTYSSPASDVALAGVDVTDYWIVDVEALAAIPIRLRTDETRTYPRDRGEFTAFGRPVSQMRYGDTRTQRGAYTAMAYTAAETDALVDLLNSGHTLLVQGPREPQDGPYPRHLYMAVVDDPTSERLVQGPFAYRVLSWSWRADDPPVGEGYGGLFPAGYAGTL